MHTFVQQLIRTWQLDAARSAQLWRLSGLHEPPPQLYRRLFQGLALVAALLLGAGLVFFVAALMAYVVVRLGELKRRVDNGEMKVAFALYPVSMQQLIDIADTGNIMPPKTTWFEPKLRSGLVIHKLD